MIPSGAYEALERFHRTGPEFGGFLADHGPMVAEAMARRTTDGPAGHGPSDGAGGVTRMTPVASETVSVSRQGGTRTTESRTRALLRVRDAMDRRYAEPLDLTQLAALVHLSPRHFLREFATAFGETPRQYLYRRRMERAATLLRSTDRSVTEIAREVGYESLGTFTRTFTRLYGHSPLRHRALGPLPAAPACWLMAAGRPVPPGSITAER